MGMNVSVSVVWMCRAAKNRMRVCPRDLIANLVARRIGVRNLPLLPQLALVRRVWRQVRLNLPEILGV